MPDSTSLPPVTYAKAGDRRSTERALAAVETVYGRRTPGDDPEWVYWLNEDEIAVMAGRCYVELGQPDRAVDLLSGVLAHYDERLLLLSLRRWCGNCDPQWHGGAT